MKDKLYRVLARQENISTNRAKELVDRGLVSMNGKRVTIARALIDTTARLKVAPMPTARVIYEDDDIIAVDKPAFLSSDEIASAQNAVLLHRLDKETSGVLLLCKNEEFRARAILEFKNLRVQKRYFAAVAGIVSENIVVDEPILTTKSKGKAFSRVAPAGKPAHSEISPVQIVGKKSLVSVRISTGRTHQIRVHLSHIGHAIIGDARYGAGTRARSATAERIYLHASEISLLHYHFASPLPREFAKFGFEISGL